MMAENTILWREYCLKELPELVSDLLKTDFMEERVCLLVGDLGAGKTTLVKAIVEEIAPGDTVTSPTFSLINEYLCGDRTIYHMDLYRLNNMEEAMDIGIEDYFYKGNCFIEWPEIAADLLPDTFCKIEIENLGNFTRRLTLKKVSNIT